MKKNLLLLIAFSSFISNIIAQSDTIGTYLNIIDSYNLLNKPLKDSIYNNLYNSLNKNKLKYVYMDNFIEYDKVIAINNIDTIFGLENIYFFTLNIKDEFKLLRRGNFSLNLDTVKMCSININEDVNKYISNNSSLINFSSKFYEKLKNQINNNCEDFYNELNIIKESNSYKRPKNNHASLIKRIYFLGNNKCDFNSLFESEFSLIMKNNSENLLKNANYYLEKKSFAGVIDILSYILINDENIQNYNTIIDNSKSLTLSDKEKEQLNTLIERKKDKILDKDYIIRKIVFNEIYK